MLKSALLVSTLMALLFSVRPQNDRFSRYKSIETYEIRPGILVMPRYAADGEVCEITMEKHHFDNGKADLNTTIPRETFIQLVDELAPPNERGRQTMDFGREYMSAYSGHSVTTFAEYENVSIDIVGKASHECGNGDIVAVIKWKKRTCGTPAHQ
jgi:hypothetical protein